jgi:hypothetical protein
MDHQQIEQQLLAVATEAQRRIDDALARMTPSEITGSNFDQAGLRDGLEIVEDHLRVGERGLAFEHLLYMVVETDIALSASSVLFVEQTAAAFELPAPRIRVTG